MPKSSANDETKPQSPSPASSASPADLAKADLLRTVAGTMKRHHATTDWNDRDAAGFAKRVADDLAAQADVLDPPSPPPPAPEASPDATTSEDQPKAA